MCEAIAADPGLADTYTWRSHVVAVVSDGTAVLGLGDIGPLAALPVMEGKALLFKDFGGVDAVPIVLDTTDVDEIVETVVRLAPEFRRHQPRGHQRAALLRDRGAAAGAARHPGLPRRPARHRDRGAGRARKRRRLINRPLSICASSVSGAGAAGVAVTKILLEAGIGDIAVGDSKGIVHAGRDDLEPA